MGVSGVISWFIVWWIFFFNYVHSQRVIQVCSANYNKANEMASLNKYIRILNGLKFSNIATKFYTSEIKKKSRGRIIETRVQTGLKEFYSVLSLSLKSPSGKPLSVVCSGRNICRDLAEKEAVNCAEVYLLKLCEQKTNLEKPYEIKSLLESDKGDQYNEFELRNHLSNELPFFNQEPSYFYDQSNTGWCKSRDKTIFNYQSNYQNINSKRFYSSDIASVSSPSKLKTTDSNNNTQAVNDFDVQYADTLKVFPAPRNFIGNIYEHVRRMNHETNELKSHNIQRTHNMEWIYTLTVTWPVKAVFKGIASTKKEAAKRASVLCIKWLQQIDKVDEKGNLKLVDKSVIVDEAVKPLAEIVVNVSYISSAETLISQYMSANMEERLQKEMEHWEESDLELCTDFSRKEITPNVTISESLLTKRNKELYQRLLERRKYPDSVVEKLPINAYKDEIAKLINDNQVLVVKGEPGCGKSTQVPQVIIDYFTEKMEATDCNIVVTQPRRISAITLAERIASERREVVGDVVGYQVRLQSMKPRREKGCILFCSTGVLLRKLLSNPDMHGISHVIIDEAHERDLNTDFMLLLTKRAAANNPNLKIVIMSATINPELFQNYFEKAGAIHIPGFTHPVQPHFLDDNLARIIGVKSLDSGKSDFPVVDVRAIARLVMWINKNKPPGAVLVFLPGWSEIHRLQTELLSMMMGQQLLILPIHSRLSHADQKRIFCRPPPGMRKVILATNIAETSITIDDVNYVIDSGAHKEERLNSEKGTLAIDNQWVSQASARQRKGRAGRVGPGECYHLYTKENFDTFIEFPVPEVHRARLETSVLNSKVYSGNEKAEDFLKQLPEPPSLEMIRDAVKKLQWAGALDNKENLTPLGTRISVFTTHPFISKALIHSFLFKCVNPMVTIGTLLSSEVELFPGTLGDKASVREIKRNFSSNSDHIALQSMFNQWEENNENSENGYGYRARKLAESMQINPNAFQLIGRLRNLIGEHLYQCGMLECFDDYKNTYSDCNTYSNNEELVKGVLLSGIGNLLSVRNWMIQKGVMKKKNVILTETGQRATISAESVNHKRNEFPSPFFTYFNEMRSEQQRSVTIRETSILSPLTLVFFQCATLSSHPYTKKGDDPTLEKKSVLISLSTEKKSLNVFSDKRTGEAIMKLRRMLWSIIGYLVRESGNPLNEPLYREVISFHHQMLDLMDKMLREQATKIEDINHNRSFHTKSVCSKALSSHVKTRQSW